MTVETTHALDVWLRFESDDDEEPSHEANTFRDSDGFRVEWYHTAVGQVSSRHFDTYADVQAWLISQGFSDFSS
jgi:hypothetical protein